MGGTKEGSPYSTDTNFSQDQLVLLGGMPPNAL